MSQFIRQTIRNLLARFGYTLVRSSAAASIKTKRGLKEEGEFIPAKPLAPVPGRSEGAVKLDPPVIRNFFSENGFYVFRNIVPFQHVDAIKGIVDRDISQSDRPMLRHPSNRYEPNVYADVQNNGNHKQILNALSDPHRRSESIELGSAILDMVCTSQIAAALNAIDGAESYTVHQTILFFIGPMTDLHIDGWGLDTVPPGGAYTLWIPLEPINLRNGPICVVPWKQGNFLTPAELGIEALPETEDEDRTAYRMYHRALLDRIAKQNPVLALPQFAVGDFIAFSSLTPHGTLPATALNQSRMAIQVLVRPSKSSWAAYLPRMRGEVTTGDPKVVAVSDHWHVVV